MRFKAIIEVEYETTEEEDNTTRNDHGLNAPAEAYEQDETDFFNNDPVEFVSMRVTENIDDATVKIHVLGK